MTDNAIARACINESWLEYTATNKLRKILRLKLAEQYQYAVSLTSN